MNIIAKRLPVGILLPVLGMLTAHATTGYFMHANGVKAQGNAGASIAHFNDALTIANNPAGLSWVGHQLEVGATLFAPDRSSTIQGNMAGADGQYEGNGREYFVLPEIAYSHPVNDQVRLGFAIYGNGGMNTEYDRNPYAAFSNRGAAGVNLTQVFISPAVSWKYAPHQSIGLATHILYQQFEAKGISGFAPFSQQGQNLSNRGKDSATGLGIRVGWAGAFFDEQLLLGWKYSSKIKADKFDRYRGLFAQNGDFDVPESYGFGIGWNINPKLNIAADVERINYSDVDSIARDFDFNQLMQGHVFGTNQGPGFGWDDINIYKLGLTYQATDQLTLRAGYSHNDQPVKRSQTFLNILAPGVVQDHISVGASWKLDQHQELSVAYTHALEQEVKGHASIPNAFGGGEADVKMSQNLAGLSYSYNF